MVYSLDNAVSVPTDILFLQPFDSFHMKATKISIRMIWLFLFLELEYLQHGLGDRVLEIYINQTCTVWFVMLGVFIIWWLKILQFTNEEMHFEEQRSGLDLKTSIAWNVQSNFNQGISLAVIKVLFLSWFERVILLMFIIIVHHHQNLCSSNFITMIYLTWNNTCNAEQKQSCWFTSKFIKFV